MIIVLLLIVGGCFSYAIFTARSEAKGALNIVTGNLYSLIDSTDLDANKSVTIPAGANKQITLKLTNVNGIEAKANLYYSSTSSDIEIGYLSDADEAPTTSGVILGKNGSTTDYKKINIQIKNNSVNDETITFGTNIGLSNSNLDFPSGKSVINRINNMYIDKAYVYDESNASTLCITGEEQTCLTTDCYKNFDTVSCVPGTIIKYKINDTEEKYFNVLHDDGNLITLQQTQNTINFVPWNIESDDNTRGPITVLPQLEEATASWGNVSDQTYTMGTTAFASNSFTGCSYYNNCNLNTYTLGARTAKARMVTVHETTNLGCKNWSNSCPKWLYNNLHYSTTSSGMTNDNTQNTNNDYNSGYWTMSGSVPPSYTSAWYVRPDGYAYFIKTTTANIGARAVIVISK